MMMRTKVGVVLCAIFYFISNPAFADSGSNVFTARKVQQAPIIDGILTDDVWELSEKVEFTEFSPSNGKPSGFKSAIDIIYTDNGIYIAAKLYDPHPNKIPRELGSRDDDGRNADEFGILLDTYNNGQNAFAFKVSSAGVQTDIYFSGGSRDRNWDAVWESAISFDEEGWNVEMRIPYYALRFAKKEEQVWGVNFLRKIQRFRKQTYWNPVDNSVRGLINQSGKLKGLEEIEPPLRLSLLPYITAVYDHQGSNGKGKASLTGGMNLKYGINESFTLDVSLVPDFSQVRSDDQVLNLSPFEVRYGENRPFFTENMDIFNKGGLFYSRRVGQANGKRFEIGNDDQLVSTPGNAPLINATKLSGRTKNGTGIGVFNGITRRTYAEVDVPDMNEGKVFDPTLGDSIYSIYNREKVLYDPLTNFNVLVIDQNLKHNSNIGIINTNVIRSDGGDDANVTGVDGVFYDKTNTYQARGFYASSWILTKDENDQPITDRGFKYNLSLAKVSGRWQYRVGRNVESDNYDINDLGFLRSPNEVSHYARLSYNIFQPFGFFNRMSYRLYYNHQSLYAPKRFVSYNTGVNGNMQFTNFWGIGYNLRFIPIGENDYFESRNDLPFVQPWAWNFNMNMYTDSRKPLFFNVWGGKWFRPDWEQEDYWVGAFTRFRVNDKLSFTYNISRNESKHDIGWVNVPEDARKSENINLDATIFGARDRATTENRFGLNYTFTNKVGLNMRIRHIWSTVDYEQFYYLQDDGVLEGNEYSGSNKGSDEGHDINFNAFNIDLNFKWQVAPGSFFTVAWKNSSVFNTDDTSPNFSDNFSEVVREPHNNSLSMRLTYFIDYMSFKNSI